jgi:hypothetical protein
VADAGWVAAWLLALVTNSASMETEDVLNHRCMSACCPKDVFQVHVCSLVLC